MGSQSLQTNAEHSCAFITPPTHSLFIYTFFFHLNSLVHSCLNLFHSGAVETDRQVAAELNLGRAASHPVLMPTREARGRDTRHQTTPASMRTEPELKKKKITNKWIVQIKILMWCTLATSDWIVSRGQFAHSYIVFYLFLSNLKIKTWNSKLTVAGTDSPQSWPLQGTERLS